jgi:hypothetical protein
MKKLGVITSLALVAFLAISVVPAGAQTPAGTTASVVSEPAPNSTPAPASVTSNLNLLPSLAPQPAAASSSDTFHRFEVFGGYSFLNNNIAFADSFGVVQLLHGYAASATVNLTRNFGVTADFSGHNGSTNQFGQDQDEDQYYFLFGPEVSHSFGKARISGHVLVGAAREHFSIVSEGSVSKRETNFAAGVGGTFDWMFCGHWGWRVLQFDYLTNIFDGGRVNNVRGSTGFIFSFK